MFLWSMPIPMKVDPYGNEPRNSYYSFTWGSAQIIVLDPYWYTDPKPTGTAQTDCWGWTLGDAQYHWLEQVLATSTSQYKLVFIHHLVGGSLPSHLSSTTSSAGTVAATKGIPVLCPAVWVVHQSPLNGSLFAVLGSTKVIDSRIVDRIDLPNVFEHPTGRRLSPGDLNALLDTLMGKRVENLS